MDEVLADRRLLSHPFYRRWEAGELVRGELAAYAAQYRYFEAVLPEMLAGARDALPDGEARKLVEGNLEDELGVPAPHLELFDRFARAVGAGEDEPTPATSALIECYRESARRGPVAVLAALAAYEVQAASIARSKADGLRARYGLTDSGTRFWDVHAVMDRAHGTWALEALTALDPDEDVVGRNGRAAADAWWAFLDERQEAATELAAC